MPKLLTNTVTAFVLTIATSTSARVMRRTAFLAFASLALGLGSADSVSAQVVGTFRWQLAPFCNAVTLLVEQKGAVYELTGSEDGCNGAAPSATANGSAHLNTDGSVTLSLAMTRPDGFVINAGASLNIVTLSGTWRDDWDNSGTLVFNPAAPAGGAPRPLTMKGEWSVLFSADFPSDSGYTTISFPRALPVGPFSPPRNHILPNGAPTANCPGSAMNPQAAPGQLCIYQVDRQNVWDVRMFSRIARGTLSNCDTVACNASPFGFTLVTYAGQAGFVRTAGSWAVTVP